MKDWLEVIVTLTAVAVTGLAGRRFDDDETEWARVTSEDEGDDDA